MGKTVIAVMLALATISCMILVSGCNTEAPIGNDTTPVPTAQRPNVASQDTVPVSGYVYLEGKNVTCAYVKAVSVDGTDSVVAGTDESGAYTLNVKAGTWYKVTAFYKGLQHTVFPVVLQKAGNQQSRYDINLTKTQRSTIAGSATPDSQWNGSGVHIEAVENNNSTTLTATTGDDGSYAMEVEPNVYYYVVGWPRHHDDQYSADIQYRNEGWCSKIKVGPDETALLDYRAVPILSVGCIMVVQAPPGPFTISGYVYLDDMVISGATVEAVSVDGADHMTAKSDGNGAYAFSLESQVPYRITAKFMGYEHSLWPVYVSEDYRNSARTYDINLTTTPKSNIAGSVRTHHILIKATPVSGGSTVSTMNGYNYTYSIDVEPDRLYHMTGEDYYGQIHFYTTFRTRDGNWVNTVSVRPNETFILDADAIPPI